MTPLLEMKLLDLKFVDFVQRKEQRIFSQVNFQVFEGESVVIIGPSGQGKSLFLRLMGGLTSPTAGEVIWHGQNVATMSKDEKSQKLREIGMLFQKNALFDSLNVYDNVAFPLRERTTMNEKQIQEKVSFYLEAVGLKGSEGLFPNEISGGMQKRLGIARALALDPKIIFYDDPTAGLDPITSRKIIQLILSEHKRSKSTILTVTNDMNRAFQLAGRIVMVVNQEVIETGSKDQTLQHTDPRVKQFIWGKVSGPLSEFD